MTLDEAYRHIKDSYIHHTRKRNAVFLPQAELIAMECIKKVKELQPVKRGRWLNTNTLNHLRCSNCNVIHFIAQYPYWLINYCPNCGADMRDVPETDVGEIDHVMEFKKRMED